MLEEEIYGENSPIWEADFTVPASEGTQLGHQTGELICYLICIYYSVIITTECCIHTEFGKRKMVFIVYLLPWRRSKMSKMAIRMHFAFRW